MVDEQLSGALTLELRGIKHIWELGQGGLEYNHTIAYDMSLEQKASDLD